MRPKVLYILFGINESLSFRWIVKELKDKIDFEFVFLLPEKSKLAEDFGNLGIPVTTLSHRGKVDYPKNLFLLIRLICKKKPNIVHTHLFDANILGLIAAKICRVKVRVYTRHHSTFHHVYFPNAVKWDKLSNYLATHIIAISKNVYNVLEKKEKVSISKIHLIHHGFDLRYFRNIEESETKSLRVKYDIPASKTPIIGVISRHHKLKGIQSTIIAFKEVLKEYPKAMLVLANAKGSDSKYIDDLLCTNLNRNSFRKIEFEANLKALYSMFDIFVHVPVNKHIEAFGQIYVESLAAGVPSVFTLSGIANEFILNRQNALVVDYEKPTQIFDSIIEYLTDEKIKKVVVQNGYDDIQCFNIKDHVSKLYNLYQDER